MDFWFGFGEIKRKNKRKNKEVSISDLYLFRETDRYLFSNGVIFGNTVAYYFLKPRSYICKNVILPNKIRQYPETSLILKISSVKIGLPYLFIKMKTGQFFRAFYDPVYTKIVVSSFRKITNFSLIFSPL